MEIIKKEKEVQIGTLNYGDVCQAASGRIYMVVNGLSYVKDDNDGFTVVIVDLERGIVDRMHPAGIVRPVKLVAREE